MAKLGKALFFTAAAAAITAGGMAIYNKYKASTDDFDDDFLDFDDEDEDLDDLDFDDDEDTKEDNSGREYVSIPKESTADKSDDESKVNVSVKISDNLDDDDDDYADELSKLDDKASKDI